MAAKLSVADSIVFFLKPQPLKQHDSGGSAAIMQERSVHQTRVLWQNERKFCRYLSSFPTLFPLLYGHGVKSRQFVYVRYERNLTRQKRQNSYTL